GKYAKFPPVRSYPKPIQQPGPPVLIGSRDKNALKRVAKWGDGWFPNRVDVPFMKEQLAILKQECTAAGRDFKQLDITVMGAISGDRAQVQDQLHQYAEAGVQRYVAGLGSFGPSEYKQPLAHLASLYV
ncbi:MAG: LLM class flavin-dependent oxidoreductase, partial [Candidatus Binataceae bacterium]